MPSLCQNSVELLLTRARVCQGRPLLWSSSFSSFLLPLRFLVRGTPPAHAPCAAAVFVAALPHDGTNNNKNNNINEHKSPPAPPRDPPGSPEHLRANPGHRDRHLHQAVPGQAQQQERRHQGHLRRPRPRVLGLVCGEQVSRSPPITRAARGMESCWGHKLSIPVHTCT